MTKNDEFQEVFDRLDILAPGREEAPRPPADALAQLQKQIRQHEPSPLTEFNWRLPQMLNRKYTFAVLAFILMLAVAFSFPPVRAAASEFLGLFRVQEFAAISVSPEQVAMLEQLADEGLYPGEIQMNQEPGQPEPVASLAEAETKLGRPVATAPSLGAPTAIHVATGGSGRLLVDLESARMILESAGLEPTLLPDSLDGAAIDVTVFPSVEQQWGKTTLVQTESPLVDYPEAVDPAVVGEAFLRLLGMAPQEAERVAENIDWTSTILLPIPEHVATFREVNVNGNSGLALSSVDGQGSSLMWQEGGIVYLLAGAQDVDALVALAGTID